MKIFNQKILFLFVAGIMCLGNHSSYATSRYDVAKMKQNLVRRLAVINADLGTPIYLRIFKKEAELELWASDRNGNLTLFQSYPICNYSGYLGPKLKEGDYQSPEGFYSVSKSQLNPKSSYHLSFNLGFPNTYDKSHARTGSYLMVHGDCVSIGCYAMTNEKIEEIYTLVKSSIEGGLKKVPVHAFPFRLSDENMQIHGDSEWVEFWQNLKQGYDFFETTRKVPSVDVVDGVYVFEE